jgi:hypothetical protein
MKTTLAALVLLVPLSLVQPAGAADAPGPEMRL